MVSSFLQYCKWFFLHLPVESGYFIAPLRINGSAIESLFSLLKYGAGGQLSAINYGSGLERIQARTEVARTKCTGDGYRNDAVMPATSNSEHSPAAVPIVSGRSKAYGFSVKEFLFPSLVCQSVLGGEKWQQCLHPYFNICWKFFFKDKLSNNHNNCATI